MTGFRLFPEIRQRVKDQGLPDPYTKYLLHKAGADVRGIGFHMSFEEWWGLWEPHWKDRGRGSLQKCMCRKSDQGAYEVGNVRIATAKENQHERALEFRTKRMQKPYRKREHRTKINPELVEWAGFRDRSIKDEDEEI